METYISADFGVYIPLPEQYYPESVATILSRQQTFEDVEMSGIPEFMVSTDYPMDNDFDTIMGGTSDCDDFCEETFYFPDNEQYYEDLQKFLSSGVDSFPAEEMKIPQEGNSNDDEAMEIARLRAEEALSAVDTKIEEYARQKDIGRLTTLLTGFEYTDGEFIRRVNIVLNNWMTENSCIIERKINRLYHAIEAHCGIENGYTSADKVDAINASNAENAKVALNLRIILNRHYAGKRRSNRASNQRHTYFIDMMHDAIKRHIPII